MGVVAKSGFGRAAIDNIELPRSMFVLHAGTPTHRPIRYRLEFTTVGQRVEVLDEAIEETEAQPGEYDVYFYYRFQGGAPAISVRDPSGKEGHVRRHLQRETLVPDESVLAQRQDPDLYPELTWVGKHFGAIQTFREWTFGRYTTLRQPQPADLPEDRLLPDARNLALVLNQIEHRDGRRFDDLLTRFFPRYERMSTRVSGGTVQFYLHGNGIPGTDTGNAPVGWHDSFHRHSCYADVAITSATGMH